MVKSKKMSKSTVAIVLLSLLLVLSLILTATGAWFTASANKTTSGANGSWTLGDFITLSVNGEDNSEVYATTEILGAEQRLQASDKLHPGDKIHITDGAQITVSASDDQHSFWYIISEDGGTNWTTAKAWVKGTDTNKTIATITLNATLTDDSSLTETIEGGYQIKTSTTTAQSGTVAISIEGANLIVRACQYNNVKDATEAEAILKAMA